MESPVPNPYSTPAANLYGAASGSGADAVSPGTIAVLAGTKPWVRFMSVMLWLGVAFTLLGAVMMGGMAILGMSNAAIAPPPFGATGMGALAVLYVVMACVYVYPAVKLWSYATQIGRLGASRTVADLDAALTEQRRFWKFVGVAFITLMSLYAVAIIGMIAAGAAGAFNPATFR